MCSSPEGLCEMASWEGKGPESRQKLIEKLQSKMFSVIHSIFNFILIQMKSTSLHIDFMIVVFYNPEIKLISIF